MKGSINMTHDAQAPVRCGLVLAGGEGKRLKRFIYQLRASQVPKQYINVIGTRSMLEHTFDRAERLIPRERLFTVASRAARPFPNRAPGNQAKPPRSGIRLHPAKRKTESL